MTQITTSLSEKMKLKKQQKEIAKKQKMLVAGTGRLYDSGKFILNNLKKTLEGFKEQARTAGIYDKVEPIIKEIEDSFGQYYTDLKDMEGLVKTMNGSRKARSSKSEALKAVNTRFEKVSSELGTKLQILQLQLNPPPEEEVVDVPEEPVIMGVDTGVGESYSVEEDGVIDIFDGPDIISNPDVVGPLDIFEKE